VELKISVVAKSLQKSYDAQRRIIAMQGGTRSGKTYNILCWFIVQALTNWSGKTISIVRQTLPALKSSAERDFFEILGNLGLYNESEHNKTDRLYKLGGNIFEFFACDGTQKVRGRKRDILFCNEANELQEQTYKQLALRTKDFIIIDYNPSEEEHWIYDKILTDTRTDFYKTTYKDNPFLDRAIIEEIESLKDTDDTLWRVFGLGERGYSTAKIYTNNRFYDLEEHFEEVIYGIDFGYNNPTAIVKVGVKDKCFFVSEVWYETKQTNTDLIAFIDTHISKRNLIFADSAEPNRIEELRRAGFWVEPAKKDVKNGIDFCKAQTIFYDTNSSNLKKELRSYKWKEANGKVLDEPVKFLDHLLDAMRYAIYSRRERTQNTVVKIRQVKKRTNQTSL
jgi:phage terminase large subunit